MVFVHALEVVFLLTLILFPYRLSFSRLPPTLSPSSNLSSLDIFPRYIVFFSCLLERVSVILFFHCQHVSSFLSSFMLLIYPE